MSRQSTMMSQEQRDEIDELFREIDEDGNSYIDKYELADALKRCGINVPSHRIREYIEESEKDSSCKRKDGHLDRQEFEVLYQKFNEEKNVGRLFKKQVHARQDIQTTGGSIDGIQHSIKDTERYAFADWMTKNLAKDPECQPYLPIDPDSDDLFKKVCDGILLCKLINNSVENTIDERTINKTKLNIYLRTENQNLALASASAIGCNVVNIGHGDIEKGVPHLVLGLLWQIIRIGLLSEINLADHPGLVLLLRDGESIDDLLKLSPEEILIRWVNYHLAQAGDSRTITNFTNDIKDSEVYYTLLNQIAPDGSGVSHEGSDAANLEQRAENMLGQAEKIQCRAFITASDVVKGNGKLNLAFVANLFNNYPALDKDDKVEFVNLEETREEKTYRNWMNSMGVNPFVSRLYADLQNGKVLFQLYELINPGCVDWKKVVTEFHMNKLRFECIGNCNYAVELGKQLKFSLVGVAGPDLVDGNQVLTLALVWQLMRAYTVAMLKKVSPDGNIVDADKMIIEWANEKLKSEKKTHSFRNFKDSSLQSSLSIIELIDAIVPGKIKWDIVNMDPQTDEEKFSNAKYAISMGRKIGARIYALPEDIVEGKPKMIMTIFACLMTVSLKRGQNNES